MSAHLLRAAIAFAAVICWGLNSLSQEGEKGAEQLPALPPISVHFDSATLADVCQGLSKAAGVPFAAGQASLPAAFSVTAKERPLWEVFVELAKQHSLLYRPSRNGVELTAQDATAHMAVVAPLLIVAEVDTPNEFFAVAQVRGLGGFVPGGRNVVPRYTGRGPGAEPPPPDAAEYILSLAAIGDPRLIATDFTIDQIDVRDDRGEPIQVLSTRAARMTPGATSGPWQPRPNDYERTNLWAWRMVLGRPQAGGRDVGVLKGVIKMQACVNEVKVRLDDIENKHHDEEVAIGNHRFTLTSANFAAPNARVFNLQYHAELHGPPGSPQTIAPLRVELKNAAGDPVAVVLETRETSRGSQPVPRSIGPLSLELTTGERVEEFKVPFEIKFGD